MVYFLVKNNKRAALEAIWEEISYLMNCRIIPNNPEDYFLYRIKEGAYSSYFYSNPQKWSELNEKVASEVDGYIPDILKRFHFYPYYMLLNFPHRLDQKIIKFL